MDIKNKVTFSLVDLHQAITNIALKNGVSMKENLTKKQLRTIIDKGGVTIIVPQSTTIVIDHDRQIHFSFFEKMAGHVSGLKIFLSNVVEDTLFKYFDPIFTTWAKEEKDFVLDYLKAKAIPFLEPGPKEIFGEEWRESWEKLNKIYSAMGTALVIKLQSELRNGTTEIKGSKLFTKESEIIDKDLLGFSGRVTNYFLPHQPYGQEPKPFILKDCFNESQLRNRGLRNIGKKALREVEDFMLLYNLF